MKNDIKAIENKFVNSMGSGVASGRYLRDMIVDAVETRDGRPLASAIARLTKKGDKLGVQATRSIIGAIMPDAKLSLAKDKKTVLLSLKDAKFDDEAMQRMHKAVERQLSIRSTLVKEVKGDTGKKELDLKEVAANVLKRVHKEGITKAALIAAIQAAEIE